VSIRFDFSGRTSLVTGAAQGIGHAIAMMFLEAGGRVAVLDHNKDELESVWERSDTVAPHAVDVRDTGSVANAIAEVALWSGGGVDIAVNNAGIVRDGVVWKLSDADWQAVLDVHLNGTFNVTRSVIPLMRRRKFGRIVNVTSYTGMHGAIGQANYAAAKGGIIGFTKTVAKETARFGITVNAISPNAATPMVTSLSEDRMAAIAATVPLGRIAPSADMAAAVGYLASDEASYVTGVVLPVDGGLAM
jgi:3-oxoacyl-[acyl-carrier protein] reductase